MIKIKGQSLIEYSVFIFCLVAALISMQVYIKRGIQGRLRESIDDVGEQFDPRRTVSNVNYKVTNTAKTATWLEEAKDADGNLIDVNEDGIKDYRDYVSVTGMANDPSALEENDPDRNIVKPEITNRTGYEQVGVFGGLYD